MAKCQSCGADLADDANFCPKCGASVRTTAVDDMVEDARRALSQNPNDASARYNLAIAYKLGGLADLALQELARVADQQPDFADVHYEIGVLQAQAGRPKEATAALTRALSLDPGNSRAQRLLQKLKALGTTG
jgi:Flp pilus assembly protein TadD